MNGNEKKRWNLKKIKITVILSIIFLIVAGEIALRKVGFANAPLYRDDDYSGYTQLENQDVQRFGNSFITNEFSMRSLPLEKDEQRILILGDSVLNGGAQTDHGNLATSRLEKELSDTVPDLNLRVLNISSGGWGIDNTMGVIKEKGDFNAKSIILVLNSHDAVGTISDTDIAGSSVNFPDSQYKLAWIELFDRYLIPKVNAIVGKSYDDGTNNSTISGFSEGWEFFNNYTKNNDIPLTIYLHATIEEINNKKYDENGQSIIDFADKHQIKLVKDINVLDSSDFRDGIHLTEEGQDVIYEILLPVLENQIKSF